jgi:hypothetical protein
VRGGGAGAADGAAGASGESSDIELVREARARAYCVTRSHTRCDWRCTRWASLTLRALC